MPNKKTAQNTQKTKWLLLALLGVSSLAMSFAVYRINVAPLKDNHAQEDRKPISKKEEIPRVKVSLKPNVSKGYVDLYVSNNTDLMAISLIFIVKPDVNLVKIDKNTLFADYITKQNQNAVTVAATGGPSAKVVSAGTNQMFARLYFDGLRSESDVALRLDSSEAADTQNKPVVIKLK